MREQDPYGHDMAFARGGRGLGGEVRDRGLLCARILIGVRLMLTLREPADYRLFAPKGPADRCHEWSAAELVDWGSPLDHSPGGAQDGADAPACRSYSNNPRPSIASHTAVAMA